MHRFVPLALTALLGAHVLAQGPLDPRLLGEMSARAIGPATMSGRVAAIDVVTTDPNVIWVGAATGGLWQSIDGGVTWTAKTDHLPVASIGDVAVFQRSPAIVWFGSGEGNPRNSAAQGTGVYRSSDGGETFAFVGLGESRSISRIVLHPEDRDVAWVGALGDQWAGSDQRGVFKTADGGRTWKRVLWFDADSGCADLVIDPANPDKLIAALWDYRRRPWTFRSGGPGSGIWVTLDGGETWVRRTEDDGLPAGALGRIGLALAPSRPDVVYAYVENAGANALLRSDDGARSFRKMSEGDEVGGRPFYYADLRVDPANPERVYSLSSQTVVSEDGGRTFRTLIGWDDAHPDHHALWIDPQDPRHLIDGNDGGIAISRDHGRTWRYAPNLPLAQFYHVRVDDDVPYNVYGGLQDNGSWKGPSQVWTHGGIRNHHWQEVCFGDGFDTIPDPRDSRQGYAMSQQGFLVRWNLTTGERKDIRPLGPAGTRLRFNWNAGIAIDPFEPDTLYFGSQFVHRSRDRGDTWEIISADLTTNDPDKQEQARSGGLTLDVTGAENFTTIITIAPSPLRAGILWVGTDDGRLHVTEDGGESWRSVEGNLPGVPAGTWIPSIEPSRHDAAAAFVVLDDHRRGSWKPYVLRTDDLGRTWRDLATWELRSYALAIVQDAVDPDLLFLGTELGLFFSLDGGARWLPWRHGVPHVSVMDLALQEREGDLVIGTHGRAAFVLDDIRPLRELTDAIRAAPVHLFTPPDARLVRFGQPASSRFPGESEFRGANRPTGAMLSFWIGSDDVRHPAAAEERARQERQRRDEAKPADDAVVIEITDESGAVIRTLKRKANQGLNRTTWELGRRGFRTPGAAKSDDEPAGPAVRPGRYGVTVRFRDHESKGEVRVLPDPRGAMSEEAFAARLAAQLRVGRANETMADVLDRIIHVRADLDVVQSRKPDPVPDDRRDAIGALEEHVEDLRTSLRELEEALRPAPGQKGIPADDGLIRRLDRAASGIGSHDGTPTAAQLEALGRVEEELTLRVAALNRVLEDDLARLRELVDAAGLTLLRPVAPVTDGPR